MSRLWRRPRICLLALLAVGVVATELSAAGDDWNRFRGPNGSGVIDATAVGPCLAQGPALSAPGSSSR